MAYRKITVAGDEYKWRVGRGNIEIRQDETKFKLIVPRPNPQKRWGVIVPNLEQGTLDIDIFFVEDDAQKYFLDRLAVFQESKIELVPLPNKTVSITPEWVKQQIEARLSVDWKPR